VLADRAFRDAVRAELSTRDHLSPLQQRVAQGPVVETARPDLQRLEQRSIAEIAAERAATRSTRCSTSRSPTA
jgi:hypothetical protein